MMDLIATASARQLARTAGGLYLANIVLGAFAIGFVPVTIFVAGDAAATAHNIQANEGLYRLGIVAHVVILATNVPLAVIFYELFKVVNRRLALLVVFFTLVGTAVEGANLAGQFTPLALLDGGQKTSAFTSAQLQAQAYMSFATQDVSYAINSVFFAFYGLTIGYLVSGRRSCPESSACCSRLGLFAISPTASRASSHLGSPPISCLISSCRHWSEKDRSACGC
ncbi:MAG: DUF4386 domain-containing protein [Chloroflexi bacterium]|nr:MAG: DUF4386 domain-containing protein [Chloroflexota bacterium]